MDTNLSNQSHAPLDSDFLKHLSTRHRRPSFIAQSAGFRLELSKIDIPAVMGYRIVCPLRIKTLILFDTVSSRKKFATKGIALFYLAPSSTNETVMLEDLAPLPGIALQYKQWLASLHCPCD